MTLGESTKLTEFLNAMVAKGWSLHSVSDGEDRTDTSTIDEVIKVVESVDESWIYIAAPESGKRHTLFVVLGNDPDGGEVICDTSVHDDIEAAFDAVFAPY